MLHFSELLLFLQVCSRANVATTFTSDTMTRYCLVITIGIRIGIEIGNEQQEASE